MIAKILLWIHIAAGTTGLALGPWILAARKRRGFHTRWGEAYHWVMLVVCASAICLAILHWERSSFVFYVGVFSYAVTLRGYVAAKRRRPGWVRAHIGGMIGSYIAMVTALLVVNYGNLPGLSDLPPLASWVIPTVVGSACISWVQSRWTHPSRAL